ncbi:MAG: long-chain-fatty-acid--CoA ligase [Thermoleophilia bacterium]
MTYYPDNVPRRLTYTHQPLHGLLERSARNHPDATATVFFGGSLTYREIDEHANRFAHALLSLGVEPGERVAIHLPNSPQLVICLYGALKAGAVATLVSPLYEPAEIAHQLEDSGARVMVTLSQEQILSRALAVQEQTHLYHLIVSNIKDFFPVRLKTLFTVFKEKKEGHRAHLDPNRGQLWLTDILRKQPDSSPAIDVKSTTTAVLQYTGGTTGTPKSAELTHDNLVANCTQTRAWLPDIKKNEERMLLVAPLFHVYALTCCNVMILLAGSLILLPRFDLREVLETIRNERPTIFPGIPAMYAAINHSLLRAKEKGESDLSSIRYSVSGSDRLPLDVQLEFEQLSGGQVLEGYGLTEASPITHANPVNGPRKAGSIGLPLPDTEVRIVDMATGWDVPRGEVGEMLVRGPQVMKGYWQNPAETSQVIDPDGWLSTGDIAREDEDGFYFIVDRRKEIIITGGLNVYPREIEEVLAGYDKISEVAVKGVSHRLRGEIIKAFVVLKQNEQASADEIRQYARERLADYKIPRQIEFLPELPKSVLRKVLKRQLSDEAEGDTPPKS